jgi:hypothetical protein
MKKLYVYIDETYNLQNKNQFYAFGGFVTSDNDLVKLEYKRLLYKLKLLSKKVNKEIKSTDKDSERIRNRLFKSSKLLKNIDLVGISQKKETMNYNYFKNDIFSQEVILYQELFSELVLNIIEAYNDDKIELHLIIEADKNNKIERNFYLNLRNKLMKNFNLKVFDIEVATSNISFGLQLADQIAGIYREYIKEKNYQEFLDKFKILIDEPLSKN